MDIDQKVICKIEDIYNQLLEVYQFFNNVQGIHIIMTVMVIEKMFLNHF